MKCSHQRCYFPWLIYWVHHSLPESLLYYQIEQLKRQNFSLTSRFSLPIQLSTFFQGVHWLLLNVSSMCSSSLHWTYTRQVTILFHQFQNLASWESILRVMKLRLTARVFSGGLKSSPHSIQVYTSSYVIYSVLC